MRVTVYLQGVPEACTSSFLILFALLQHEHKMTVLNFTVQRNTEYNGSVRSKVGLTFCRRFFASDGRLQDPLILCVGPRRLHINTIYSQHTRGGGKGANNVHKFERFLRHGVTNVATIYGPVVFGQQPCVLLRETSDGQGMYRFPLASSSNKSKDALSNIQLHNSWQWARSSILIRRVSLRSASFSLDIHSNCIKRRPLSDICSSTPVSRKP